MAKGLRTTVKTVRRALRVSRALVNATAWTAVVRPVLKLRKAVKIDDHHNWPRVYDPDDCLPFYYDCPWTPYSHIFRDDTVFAWLWYHFAIWEDEKQTFGGYVWPAKPK